MERLQQQQQRQQQLQVTTTTTSTSYAPDIPDRWQVYDVCLVCVQDAVKMSEQLFSMNDTAWPRLGVKTN